MNIEALKEIQNRRMDIAKRKHQDYSSVVDVIAVLGVRGAAVECWKKACRLLSLTEPGATSKVPEESIRDSFLDIGNYADYGVSLLEGTWEKPTREESTSQTFITEVSPLTGGIPESLLKAFMEHAGLKPGVTYKEKPAPLPENCLMEVPTAANPPADPEEPLVWPPRVKSPAMKKPDATDQYPLGKSWGYQNDNPHPFKKMFPEDK